MAKCIEMPTLQLRDRLFSANRAAVPASTAAVQTVV
jgi:hypothetical protein